MTTTPEAVSVVPCIEMPCQTGDAKGSPERGTSVPRSLVEYDEYGIERWALSQTSAGKLYSYRDVLKDAKGIGSPKRYQPGRSLGDGKRDQATGGEQSMEGSRLELFAAYDSLYPDDPIGDETPPSPRRKLHGGKRTSDPKVTMRRGFWHVDQYVRWSVAATVCAVCHVEMTPDGKRKYCSADCRRAGSNAVRRAKRGTKWPRDERGWYVQPPFPMPRPYRVRPKIHRYDDHEASTRHTASRGYRLRPPWHGEPYAWRIGIAEPMPVAGPYQYQVDQPKWVGRLGILAA